MNCGLGDTPYINDRFLCSISNIMSLDNIYKGLGINVKQKTIVITSGFYNPLHSGHLASLKAAKELGDRLVVIVNNDDQVKLKGSVPFMNERERLEIVRAIKYVDLAVLAVEHEVKTIDLSLGLIAAAYYSPQNRLIFAKGGDRSDSSKMPERELEVCKEYDIEVVYGVGGFDKKNSSSEILKNVMERK